MQKINNHTLCFKQVAMKAINNRFVFLHSRCFEVFLGGHQAHSWLCTQAGIIPGGAWGTI